MHQSHSGYPFQIITSDDSANLIADLQSRGLRYTKFFNHGRPIGFGKSDGTDTVAYSGMDAKPHELYFWGSGWSFDNLTSGCDGSGDLFGYKRGDNTNSVVCRGTDGHIHEIFLPPGGSWWTPADLSAPTNADAPLAAGNPSAYVHSAKGILPNLYNSNATSYNSVVYRGTDGHIHELYRPFASLSWTHLDLSASAGGPPAVPAAGDPFGYVESDGYSSVVYRGTDGHIQELYRPSNGSWSHGDISYAGGGTGAPAR